MIVEADFHARKPFTWTIKDQLVATLGPAGWLTVFPSVTKIANYTMTGDEFTVFCDTTGGAFTLTLPVAPTQNQVFIVKKINATSATLTISGNGNTIDGLTSIGTGATVDMVSLMLQYKTGTGYLIIG